MKNYINKILAMTLTTGLILSGCTGANPSSSLPSGTSDVVSTSSQGAPSNQLEKIKASGKLVLATSPDFAPYEFEDIRKSGQEAIVGAEVELARYIATGLGVELVIEPMEFGAVVVAVAEGKADIAMSGLAPKPERATAIDFSTPYGKNAGYQGVLTLEKNKDSYQTIADLKGKRIAVQNGSLQFDLTSAQVADAKLEFITSLNDGVMMLQTGKVDAMSISSATGEQFAKNYPDLIMTPIKYDYTSAGTIAGLKKGETELVEAVSKLIEEAESAGLYVKWVEEYTKLADELSVKQ